MLMHIAELDQLLDHKLRAVAEFQAHLHKQTLPSMQNHAFFSACPKPVAVTRYASCAFLANAVNWYRKSEMVSHSTVPINSKQLTKHSPAHERLTLKLDSLALGRHVQGIFNLFLHCPMHSAEDVELIQLHRSVAERICNGFDQLLMPLRSKTVSVEAILLILLWQMRRIVVFRLDFVGTVCSLKKAPMPLKQV